MGDKSPQNQIKIGNITVKLNPNNQQKTSRDSNYEKNYHRGNERNSGSNDRYKERSNERERNRYQNDNNRYTNKKNEYDNITKNIKITLTPQVSIGTPITIQDLGLETETILITITKINIITLMIKEILIIIKITII